MNSKMNFFRHVRPSLENKIRLDTLFNVVKCPGLVKHTISRYIMPSSFEHLCSVIHIQLWYIMRRYIRCIRINVRTLTGVLYYPDIHENTTIRGLKQKIWYYFHKEQPDINRNNYHKKIRIIIMGCIYPDDTILNEMHLYHPVNKIRNLNCLHTIFL